jgi:hypothetical protein
MKINQKYSINQELLGLSNENSVVLVANDNPPVEHKSINSNDIIDER